MNLKLKNKIILLTGGTGSLGGQIVLDFLQEEAIVVLLYRNEDKLEKLKNWLKENVEIKERLFAIKTSITDTKAIKVAVKQVLSQHNRIDVLVNCAGYAIEAPFLLLDEESIEQMIDINFKSPMYLAKAVVRHMMKQRCGNIINVSSVSTHSGGRGITVYAAAKAGLERFTKVLAQEVGKKNVRVNAICPGVIDNDMSKKLRSVAGNYIVEETALRRYGKSKEISKSVLFLASEEMASFVTGHILNVDGGFKL